MDKKSQVLVVVFALISMMSVVVTFQRYVLLGDIKYELDEATFEQSLLEE